MTPDSQRGMTLLETLIALVILSLAIVAALEMAGGARTLYSGAQRRQQLVEAAFAQAFIREQIEGIAPAVRGSVNGVPIVDFSGQPQEIRFVATSHAEAELPTLQRTRIVFESGELVLYRTPTQQPEAVQQRILATYPYEVRFQFGESSGGGVRFTDSWTDRSKLPDIIKLIAENEAAGDVTPLAIAVPALTASY